MTALPPPDEFLAIQNLLHDFWSRTDRVTDALAGPLFTDDAALHIGTLVVEGREAIDRYHIERRETENRTGRRVRHFCTNLLFQDYAADRAELRCSLLVFQGVGAMPFDSSLPSNIADFVISVRKEGDGQWRLVRLEGTAVFVGPGAPANARGPNAGS